MIGIIDYNVGNLFSVKNALDYIGEKSCVTRDPDEIERADALILPGVGAFPDAMRELRKTGLIDTLRAQAVKKPLLGICLGMQMLFTEGREFEKCPGLGLLEGCVDTIPAGQLKIPHMGWNSLRYIHKSPLLEGVPEGSYVYFVHSYMAFAQEADTAAYAEYGTRVTALVQHGCVFGTQFHPEKSGETGLAILRNFGRLAV